MHNTQGTRRYARAFAVATLAGAVGLGLATVAPATATDTSDPTAAVTPTDPAPADVPDSEISPTAPNSAADDEGDTGVSAPKPASAGPVGGIEGGYGSAYPVSLESTFSRPYKSISSQSNSDFTLLNDMERLIAGTYKNSNGSLKPWTTRRATYIRMTVSRMENSHRVGRKLVEAARRGVNVYFIHGKASQSKESRSLMGKLNDSKYGHTRICAKGSKSWACLSSRNGAIMHSKMLLISHTRNRNGEAARGVVWSGSANLGGPSGERTWNNALTIYNDSKLYTQMYKLFRDMWNEQGVNNDYLTYVKNRASSYAYPGPSNPNYIWRTAAAGMFYSNIANVTIYPTPINATPTNGKDPVLNALNRVIPDENCRIRVQHNRFKYRRLAVAQKLVDLANAGCKVSAIAFEDDLRVNRVAHCQLYIRICKPILDEFRRADRRIEVAWAKPHDKTLLIDAVMRKNRLNPEEVQANGDPYPSSGGARTKLVQAGSAALTGSNLVVSDEITTETTDPEVYEDYLDHWKGIWQSHEHHDYAY